MEGEERAELTSSKPSVLRSMFDGRHRRRWLVGGIIAFILVLIVGYEGVSYAQAKNLQEEGDRLLQSQQYGEALAKYQAASRKFKLQFFQKKLAPQITRATELLQADDAIKQARASFEAGDWQKCVDSLAGIPTDSPESKTVEQLSGDCYKKLAEAMKAAADAQVAAAAAAQAAATGSTAQQQSASRSRSGSSSNSSSSSSSSSNGPTIGQTSDQSSSSNNSSSNSGGSTSTSSLPSCSGSAYFTTSPINTDDLLSITPLGNFSPTSGHLFPTGHVYFFLRRSNPSDWNSAPVSTTLYAPGDITVTHITASEHVTDGYTDYSLTFSPCSEISNTFGHVTTLTQSILDQFNATSGGSVGEPYTTGGKTFRLTDKPVSIQVSAGTELGTAGGRADQNALDFGTTDTRETISFANNSRWSDSTRHAVCPLNYYSGGTKSTLVGYLGYNSTRRTIDPVCGEVSQDVANTAQGAWIQSGGSTNPEDQNITLAHDNVEPNYGVVVAGTSIPGAERSQNFFTPADSGLVNRQFSQVGADGNVYCYETSNSKGGSVNRSFIVQLTSTTALKIQKYSDGACGSGPWSFSSAIDFER